MTSIECYFVSEMYTFMKLSILDDIKQYQWKNVVVTLMKETFGVNLEILFTLFPVNTRSRVTYNQEHKHKWNMNKNVITCETDSPIMLTVCG